MTKKFSFSKKILTVLTFCIVSALLAINVFALVNPDSFYDSISWTWHYSGPATPNYNCLGFATGSMTWEWPWGSREPSVSEVDSYLTGKGYSTSGKWAYILAYGSSSGVTHFSKVTGDVWCRAKWGQLELFNHGSWDPYYHDSAYGPLVRKYFKN